MSILDGDYMEPEKFKEILRGYSVTTVTPFTQDLSIIDIDGLTVNIKFLIDNDVPLLIPNGNTGEFYSLSEHEWAEVLKITVDAAGNKTTIMSGVGHSIKTATTQIEMARSLGVPAVMIMYPQHVFVSEEGALDYYRSILEKADGMNIVLYKKGPYLSDFVLKKLMHFKSLVGVKYAFGRIVDFAKTVQDLGATIVWSCGTAERFAPFFWLAGATAFTSGLGNFAPKITARMYHALAQGDFASAMEIQRMVTPLEYMREGREKANNVPVIKYVLDQVGLVGGNCRPPIHQLSESEQEAIIRSIQDWEL
ncbi:dihydrodipicolinate synthase family protein [Candidatus Thorarchaeota archaeon]|nr:MAG: dihydrodipicolinate synthase family protein [Candidatus Thorarchaeota archaeon]